MTWWGLMHISSLEDEFEQRDTRKVTLKNLPREHTVILPVDYQHNVR